MNLLFYPNPIRDPGFAKAKATAEWCAARGAKVYWNGENNPAGLRYDFVVSLGGDGTMLNAARVAAHLEIPVIGINLGSVGFLTELERGETSALEALFTGRYEIEKRMMLHVRLLREGKICYQADVLNDCVVCHGDVIRNIRLALYSGDNLIRHFTGDGIVVSTPTGSTAYSLSAGGPIIDPACEVLLVTPICSHSLYAKSFVLCSDKSLRISCAQEQENDIRLACDGTASQPVFRDDVIEISKSETYTRFVKLNRDKKNDFFEKVHRKLAER